MSKPQNTLSLTQVRYFVRTAELGSMTATAAEMYIAQSAVSAAVAQLEAAVGSTLFIRQRARGVVLTDQGRTFYAAAVKILDAVDDAVDSVRSEQLTGSVVVGCFTTLAPFWLPELYERFTTKYPDLDVRIREVAGEEVEHILQRRELEVVLTYSFDYGRGIGFERFSEAPVYAAVSEHSHLADRDVIALEELAEEPLILLDMGKSSNYFLAIFHDAHLRPRIHERFESFEVVRSMVARGHGYTILNQRPSHDLTNDGGRLVTLPITGVRSFLHIGVAHRADEPLSHKAQAFLDECRGLFP